LLAVDCPCPLTSILKLLTPHCKKSGLKSCICTCMCKLCVPGSTVGIATRFGLGGPRFESRLCPDRSCCPYSVLYIRYQVTLQGVKLPRPGVDRPPTSRTELRERVELYSTRSLGLPELYIALYFVVWYSTKGEIFKSGILM